MKTSLVIATYNGAKYVEQQLESIRIQTQVLDEVIIMDDCSTDETVELIEAYIARYQLNHWSLEVNQKNLGFQKNFHKAIKKAGNELIFLCDQDDIWMEHKVETMVQIMANNSEIQLLASSFVLVDVNENQIKVEEKAGMANQNLLYMDVSENECINIPLEQVYRNNFAQGCCMCIRNELAAVYVDSDPKEIPHDWALVLLAASKGRCYFYNEPLMKYRIHDNNAIGLNQCITGERLESMEHRVNHRVSVLKVEQEKATYIWNYMKQENISSAYVKAEKMLIDRRVEAVKNRRIMNIMKLYLKRNKIVSYSCRSFVGDVISLMK